MLERVIQFYRCGGIVDPAALTRPTAVEVYRRVAVGRSDGHTLYFLKMPLGVGEGCKMIVTRALSRVKTGKPAKLYEIRLWEFAAVLNLVPGRTKNLDKGDLTDRALLFLQIFAASDLAVAKLPVARMLPWIKKTQNRDGSWGAGPARDAATLAVVNALAGLDRYWRSNLVLRE